MKDVLVVISSVLVLISPIVYIHSILHGRAKPHRTTRFVLTIITIVSAWSLLHGGGAAFWLALASAVQSIAVFIMSLKRGIGGWARLDIACLFIALVGIVVWQVTNQPILGLYASIIADFVGYIPGFVKTYKRPDTEDWRFFAIDTVAATLSLIATKTSSVYSLSYPIYIFIANAGMIVLIFSATKRLSQNTSD